MNIFGIGGAELILILIIMLVVAGPKRMLRWAYVLGKYIAMLQKMWGEAAATLQKEFDAAGVDVEVPKNIPTKADLQRTVVKAIKPVSQPFDDIKQEINKDLASVRETAQQANTALRKPAIKAPTPAPRIPSASNGNPPPVSPPSSDAPSFGTWSAGSQPEDKAE
jgi:sec-independent protein translocase protein TatB